jgi:Leucine-rich repeat (LRR) protein
MKYIKFLFFGLIVLSCSTILSDEELKIRFDKAYKNQNWSSSKALIDEVIERQPDSIDNYVLRAIIISHLPQRDNAQIVKDLNVYLDTYSEDDAIKVFRFQSNYLNNEHVEALNEIDELIEKKGKSAFILTWKANIAFSNKQFAVAEKAYKERLYFPGIREELKNVYYYWVLSKHFGGNTESALWELAALEDRGFDADYELMKQLENNQLEFEDYDNFVVPESKFAEVNEALNSYCPDLDIFQDEFYHRSGLLDQFYGLEESKKLDSLLYNKDEVYALNLSNTKIKELPKEVLQFKNLQYLNLSSNRFSNKEKLFDDLAKLPNLIILKLDRCYLRALPDNISKLNGLQMLSLTFNDFRKINENIGALTNLKYLNLGANGKLRELPASIGNLRCLQMLNISPNGLIGLRDELGSCNQLVSIVGNAGYLRTLPTQIGGLVNLKYVNLAANKITKLPEDIGYLSNLEDLSLGSNDIKELPASFSELKDLNFCGLAYNRFKTFPKEVLELDSLQTLWLHNNAFPKIPKEIGHLPNLTHLLVDHQVISDANIEAIKAVNSELRVIRHDTRKLVKGPKRKN